MSDAGSQLLTQLATAMNTYGALLEKMGLKLYVYQIMLHSKEASENIAVDEDCTDANCIDYVVRIKCINRELCDKIRSNLTSGGK